MNIGRAKHVVIKGHNRIAEPGQVADFGADYDNLVKSGAVVKATDVEIATFKRTKGAVPLVGKPDAKPAADVKES